MKKYSFADDTYIPASEAIDVIDELLQAGDKITSGAGYWVWEAAKERATEKMREIKYHD